MHHLILARIYLSLKGMYQFNAADNPYTVGYLCLCNLMILSLKDLLNRYSLMVGYASTDVNEMNRNW